MNLSAGSCLAFAKICPKFAPRANWHPYHLGCCICRMHHNAPGKPVSRLEPALYLPICSCSSRLAEQVSHHLLPQQNSGSLGRSRSLSGSALCDITDQEHTESNDNIPLPQMQRWRTTSLLLIESKALSSGTCRRIQQTKPASQRIITSIQLKKPVWVRPSYPGSCTNFS